MKNIVLLGDSITYGFPYGEKASWGADLEKAFPGFRFINQGINGDTFWGMYQRLERDVFDEEASLCIVMGGLNDLFNGQGLEEIFHNLQNILNALKKKNIIPVIGIPVSVFLDEMSRKEVRQLQEKTREKASSNQIFTIDFSFLEKNDYSDGVHPNHQGYRKMGEKAVEGLKELFNLSQIRP